MENRLIYFATAAEQQAENAEVSQAEQDPDSDLKKAAEDLAQLEKLKAKPGGTKAVSEARALIDNPNLTPKAKELLQKKITAVEGAVNDRKLSPGKEKTLALDSAVDALKKSVAFQKKRLSDNATANSEFGKFASLSNAKELFKDVKVSVKSETKGSVDITFDKFNSLEGFKQLGLEQKQAYLKALREKLTGGTEGGTKAIEETLKKFSGDKELPKKWQEYAKNPEKDGDSREHAAKWLSENVPKIKLHAEQYDQYAKANQPLFEKAKLSPISKTEFAEKSTSERNQYFESLKQKIAAVDAGEAERMEKMKVSEGAEVGAIDAKNVAAIEKAKSDTTERAKTITPKIIDFVKNTKLNEATKARATELEKQTNDSDATDKIANLRTQAQSEEERQSFWEKAKDFFKGDKAADDHPDQAAREKDFDLQAEARKQVTAETLENTKNREDWEKALGVKNLQKDELAKVSSLLQNEKIDAKVVEDQINADAELKKILEQKAADDYETRAAA